MLDFNAGEIVLLVVLAVIIFGPEKLPELARKAARVLNYLRGIANDARGQLREYAPELADLDIADLNPRTFGAKLLGSDTVDDLRETRRTALRDVSEAADRRQAEEHDAEHAAVRPRTIGPDAAGPGASPRLIAFDPEAT